MNRNQPNPFDLMHFKSAKIAGLTADSRDMEQINAYALSPLAPEDIFTFKVSMAGNEIDRDHEVFPRHTLSKLANLFVGKTVVKDHDHRSDNQIARIYATELVESNPIRHTKTGEVFVELIAKCYMVKTSANADLISEIRAGIRKEVSLGCRIGKAICSVCGTDNVKTYCAHFGGMKYEGKTCYFSLEDPNDAYELSFVAIPAQQHAGTVKAYGSKPCYQADMEAKEKALKDARDVSYANKNHQKEEWGSEFLQQDDHQKKNEPPNHEWESAEEIFHTRYAFSEKEQRLMVNRLVKEAKRLLLQDISLKNEELSINSQEKDEKLPEKAPKELENAQDSIISEQNSALHEGESAAQEAVLENLHTREAANLEDQNRLTVNREEDDDLPATQSEAREESCSQEESQHEGDSEASLGNEQLSEPEDRSIQENETENQQTRLTVNRLDEEFEGNPLDSASDGQVTTPEVTDKQPSDEAIETSTEAEEALKAKQAEARLRALELSLSLRQRTILQH